MKKQQNKLTMAIVLAAIFAFSTACGSNLGTNIFTDQEESTTSTNQSSKNYSAKSWVYKVSLTDTSLGLTEKPDGVGNEADDAKNKAKSEDLAGDNEEESAKKMSKSDLENCKANGSGKVIKISGSEKNITIDPADILAIRVTGNKNSFSLKLEAVAEAAEETGATLVDGDESEDEDGETNEDSATDDDDSTDGNNNDKDDEEEGDHEDSDDKDSKPLPQVAGICVFMAGNHSEGSIELGRIATGSVGFVGGGNQPVLNLTINKGAEVKGGIFAKISGNGGTFNIKGEGDYTCPDASLSGHGTAVNCKK